MRNFIGDKIDDLSMEIYYMENKIDKLSINKDFNKEKIDDLNYLIKKKNKKIKLLRKLKNLF